MKIFALAAATAAVFVSTAAFAKAETTSFQRDGYTYVYSVSEKGDAKHISGKYYPGGRSFALDVRSGRVEGVVNDSRVAFPLASVETQAGAELASAR
jgi:ABC-type amino acid transport substrate-binding protein